MDRRQILLGMMAATGSAPAMAEQRDESQIVATFRWSLDDPTWTSRSQVAEDLKPRFSFLLSRTVYVGDPNSSEQIQSGEFDRPLRLPSFAARDLLRPTAAEALGHEPELAGYYGQLMELTGRGPGPDAVGYWLSLGFVSESAGKEIGFPWWDRISEAAPFFNWLRTAGENANFHDADQGWQLRALRKGERLHFQHSDLDTEEEFANLSVDRGTFLNRLYAAEAETRTVVAALSEQLGVDPWS